MRATCGNRSGPRSRLERGGETGYKAQFSDNRPSATPQRYSRPFTVRPSEVWTSSVEPMIENGIASVRDRACSAAASSSGSMGG